MAMPGDIIICYKPMGYDAGGAAFTEMDRKDLNKLLRVVKTATLGHATCRRSNQKYNTKNWMKSKSVP